MDCSDARANRLESFSQIDYCQYCKIWFSFRLKYVNHFILRHLTKVRNNHSVYEECPICKEAVDDGLIHVKEKHLTYCVYCLKEAYLPHASCEKQVRGALDNAFSHRLFQSRASNNSDIK